MVSNKKIAVTVFILPLMVFLLSTAIYLIFISSFHGYDQTSARFIHSLELYQGNVSGNIFFIGDSQTREDIDCSLIDSLSQDSSCLNIGVEGLSALQLSLISDKIIAAKPKLVFIGVSPIFLNDGINTNNDIYFFMDENGIKPDSEIYSLLNTDEKKLFSMNFYSQALYKRRFILPFFVERFKMLFSKQDLSTQRTTSEFKQAFIYNTPQSEEELVQKLSNPQLMSVFNSTDARQQQAFVYFLKKMHEKNIPVIVVEMPLNPLLHNIVSDKTMDEYDLFIQQNTGNYGAHVFDVTDSFPKNEFIDLTHLNSHGRERLSKMVFNSGLTKWGDAK